MKNRLHLVLAQYPFQQITIGDVAAYEVDLRQQVCAQQFRVRNPVAHDAGDRRAVLKQTAHQPAAEKSRAAGNQHGPIAPEWMRSFPYLPGRLPGVPHVVQVLVFAVRVHGIEKSLMQVGLQLPVGGQSLHRLAFENASVAFEIIENSRLEDKKTGAGEGFEAWAFQETSSPCRFRSFPECRNARWESPPSRLPACHDS